MGPGPLIHFDSVHHYMRYALDNAGWIREFVASACGTVEKSDQHIPDSVFSKPA